MVELDWAAGEVAGHLGGYDGLPLPFGDAERLDSVLLLPAILDPPRLDRGNALNRPAFIPPLDFERRRVATSRSTSGAAPAFAARNASLGLLIAPGSNLS